MEGKPENNPMIREERKEVADYGEPLYDHNQSVYVHGNSLVVTVPSTARKILDIEVGDTHRVEVYRSGIWIPRGDGDE
jgi:hypothetical protein